MYNVRDIIPVARSFSWGKRGGTLKKDVEQLKSRR